MMLHFDHFYNFAAHLCEVYTLRTNSTFLCWKIKSPTFCCLKRKKIRFLQTNSLVENRFNSEF